MRQKTSFRSEIDAALATKPDTLFLNSYQPDLTVILRELYRAGFEGKKFTFGYAANDKVLAALPAEGTEGLVSFSPSPDVQSPGVQARGGNPSGPRIRTPIRHRSTTMFRSRRSP